MLFLKSEKKQIYITKCFKAGITQCLQSLT